MSLAESLRLSDAKSLRLLIEPGIEELLVIGEFKVDLRNSISFSSFFVGDIFEIITKLLLLRFCLNYSSHATETPTADFPFISNAANG